MEPGPKLIVADLNGSTDAFPTINAMIKEQGWADIGLVNTICDAKPGQPTCHTNEGTRETRIDYFFASDRLTPAITACRVGQSGVSQSIDLSL